MRDESRSPCLMASPPPPQKWQPPQLAREGRPTFCAMVSRLIPSFSFPHAVGVFAYEPVVSWQARQSIWVGSEKLYVASFQPYPAWQLVHLHQLEVTAIQKLLRRFRFPRSVSCSCSFTNGLGPFHSQWAEWRTSSAASS